MVSLFCFEANSRCFSKISVDVSSQAATLQEVIIECVQNNYYFKATERAEPILRRIKNGINNLGNLDFRLSFLATFSKSVGEPVSVTFMALVIFFSFMLRVNP